jgi:hypothetical protein
MYEDLENNWLHFHEAFLESIIFAFFESFVGVIFRWLQKNKGRDYDKPLGDDEPGAQLVGTKFADFSVPRTFTAIIFVAQFALFFFFTLDMNGDEDTHCRYKMNIFHWFAAVLVTNVSGHAESGGSFNPDLWTALWNSEKDGCKVKDHRKEFFGRLFFDATINAFSREVLLCLAPVALSVVDRDDLIKDSLAIFFISRMDDIAEDRTIDQTLTGWSREIRYRNEEDDGVEDVESNQQESTSALLRHRGPNTEDQF